MSSITTSKLKDSYLSTDFVTNIGTTDKIQQNNDNLVTSEGVYNTLSSLSAELYNIFDNKVQKVLSSGFSSKMVDNIFNFQLSANEFGGIPVLNSSPTMDVVDATTVIFADQTLVLNCSGDNASTNYTTSRYFRIPSIVKTNSGRLVAIFDIRWNSIVDISLSKYNDQCIGMSYSDDNGLTWSQPTKILQWLYPTYDPSLSLTGTYQSGASDPTIVYDEDNDVLLVIAMSGKGFDRPYSYSGLPLDSAERQLLALVWSKDNGNTWSTPVNVLDKIYDDSTCTTQNWKDSYGYLFSTCSPGLTLKRQANSADNGKILVTVQLHPSSVRIADQEQLSRSAILQINTSYDNNGDLDLTTFKMYFLNSIANTSSIIGANCGGSDEGQLCEGPNGELVYAVKAYSAINSTIGLYNNSPIYARIYKSTDLGQSWICMHDIGTNDNGVCSTLESVGKSKIGIGFFPSLGIYAICYNQSPSSTRNNVMLRWSRDLIDWHPVEMPILIATQTYGSFLQTSPSLGRIEFIVEGFEDAYNSDSGSAGSAKQLNFCSYNLYENKIYVYPISPVQNKYDCRDAYISTSNFSIQGFAFNTNAYAEHDINVTGIKVLCTRTNDTNVAHNFCILYNSNETTGELSAITGWPTDISEDTRTFNFNKIVKLEKDHEYFIRFERWSSYDPLTNADYVESVLKSRSFDKRGELPTDSGNLQNVYLFGSDTNDMKLYNNNQIAQNTNSSKPHNYRLRMQILLDTDKSYNKYIC